MNLDLVYTLLQMLSCLELSHFPITLKSFPLVSDTHLIPCSSKYCFVLKMLDCISWS